MAWERWQGPRQALPGADKLQLTGDEEGQQTDPLPFTPPMHAHRKKTHIPFCRFKQVQRCYAESTSLALLIKTISHVNFTSIASHIK